MGAIIVAGLLLPFSELVQRRKSGDPQENRIDLGVNEDQAWACPEHRAYDELTPS